MRSVERIMRLSTWLERWRLFGTMSWWYLRIKMLRKMPMCSRIYMWSYQRRMPLPAWQNWSIVSYMTIIIAIIRRICYSNCFLDAKKNALKVNANQNAIVKTVVYVRDLVVLAFARAVGSVPFALNPVPKEDGATAAQHGANAIMGQDVIPLLGSVNALQDIQERRYVSFDNSIFIQFFSN